MDQKELVKQIVTRNAKGKQDRSRWETLWEQAGQYVMAQLGSMLSGSQRTSGEKRGIKVYDGTPESAKDIMVAGMYSGLCPDNYKYSKGVFRPRDLMKVPEARKWAAEYDDIRYQVRNSTNYGSITLSAFEHQCAFGTAVKYAEHHIDKVMSWSLIDLTECVFFENAYGDVDTLFREVQFSVRDALKRFPKDKIPDEVKRADESGNKDNLFKFLHAVFPRTDYDPWKRDRLNMPFASLWIFPEKELVMEEIRR